MRLKEWKLISIGEFYAMCDFVNPGILGNSASFKVNFKILVTLTKANNELIISQFYAWNNGNFLIENIWKSYPSKSRKELHFSSSQSGPDYFGRGLWDAMIRKDSLFSVDQNHVFVYSSTHKRNQPEILAQERCFYLIFLFGSIFFEYSPLWSFNIHRFDLHHVI